MNLDLDTIVETWKLEWNTEIRMNKKKCEENNKIPIGLQISGDILEIWINYFIRK